MPKMTKGNARQMLQRTLTRFKQVTGQRVAVVFTWEGKLSVLANAQYAEFIHEHKDIVWSSLAVSTESNPSRSIPSRDLEMAENIASDLLNYNVKSLRSMISWLTQKYTGWF